MGGLEAAGRGLFRTSPRPPPLTPERVLIWIALTVAGVAVVLLRLGGTPLSYVWAEDGGIFLEQALRSTLLDAVSSTYGGYLHLVPRLLAEVTTALPIEWAAATMAILGSLTTIASAYVVWRASEAHLPEPALRGFLSAMVILLPVVGFEALANITYAQWTMGFAAFWLILWRPPTRRGALLAGLFTFLTVASAPLILFLAPLVVLRVKTTRDLRDPIAAGFAVGAVIQLIAIALDNSTQVPPGWDWSLIPGYLLRIVGGIGVGQDANAALWKAAPTPWLVTCGFAFGLIAWWAVARGRPVRPLALLALGLSVVLTLVPGYQRDLGPVLLWPHGQSHTYGARYTMIPALLLLTAFLIQLSARAGPRRPSRPVRWIVVGILSVAALATFSVADPGRSTYRWSGVLDDARAACAPGVSTAAEIPVSWPDWRIDIPCDAL